MKRSMAILFILCLLPACVTTHKYVTDNVYTSTRPPLEVKVSDRFEYLGQRLITVQDTYGGSSPYMFYLKSNLFVERDHNGSFKSLVGFLIWEPYDIKYYLASGRVDALKSYYWKREMICGKEFKCMVTARHNDSLKYFLPVLKDVGLDIPKQYLAKMYYTADGKRSGTFIIYIEATPPNQIPVEVNPLPQKDVQLLHAFEKRAENAISYQH